MATGTYDALREVLHQVAPEVDLGEVDPDQSMRQELDLDSLDFLAVVERMAALTGVVVPESDYLTVDSVNGFVRYVDHRRP